MCQFDVSQYVYPCHTFVYRLVHRCGQAVTRCRKVALRQRHIRKDGPCRHPEVCNWCFSVKSLGKDAVMKFWNEAKSSLLALHMGTPVLPAPVPVLEADSVEYNGTTYYVSPSEFQHCILPTILKETTTKRTSCGNKTAKRKTGSPVVVSTPDWKKVAEKSAAAMSLETVVYTADKATQMHPPLITKPTRTNRRNTNIAIIGREHKSGRGYFIQPQNDFPELCRRPFGEWKFHEEVDQQGRFIVAVSHCWNVQFPESAPYHPWPTSIQPGSLIYEEYLYPIYQLGGYYRCAISL